MSDTPRSSSEQYGQYRQGQYGQIEPGEEVIVDADVDKTAINMERMKRRAHPIEQGTRHSRAFIVEALMLLMFMMASLAILTSLMVSSYETGAKASDLSYAVLMASNDAESFAADPASYAKAAKTESSAESEAANPTAAADVSAGAAEGSEAALEANDDFQLNRNVEQHKQEAGVLYEAHITVSHDGEVVYELDTSRYVSNKEVK